MGNRYIQSIILWLCFFTVKASLPANIELFLKNGSALQFAATKIDSLKHTQSINNERCLAIVSNGEIFGLFQVEDIDSLKLTTPEEKIYLYQQNVPSKNGVSVEAYISENIEETGFVLDNKINPNYIDNLLKKPCLPQNGKINYEFSTLAKGETYYIKAYYRIAANIYYSNQLRFTTGESPVQSTLNVNNDSITAFSAVLRGQTGFSVVPILSCGFAYSTAPNVKLNTCDGFSIGYLDNNSGFSTKIQGLKPNTRYYYRAYVCSAFGVSYGNEIYFDTNQEMSPKSNSYIISKDQSLLIPVSIANDADPGSIGVNDSVSVELLWTDVPNPFTLSSAISVLSVKGKGANAGILIKAGQVEGNALIGALVNGVIKWSWHIWVSDYKPETTSVQLPSGAIAMDRNLGAISASKNDGARTYGLFYQYGRKDPFPGFSAGEKQIYNKTGKINILKQIAPTKVNGKTNLLTAIQNPNVFYIYENVASADWLKSDTLFNSYNYWQSATGLKSIWDPCPCGWKIPSVNDLSRISSYTVTWDSMYKGGLMSLGALEVWFPTSGMRSDIEGELLFSNRFGYYWTSTLSGKGANVLLIGEGFVLLSNNVNSRSSGFCIRCIKE